MIQLKGAKRPLLTYLLTYLLPLQQRNIHISRNFFRGISWKGYLFRNTSIGLFGAETKCLLSEESSPRIESVLFYMDQNQAPDLT